MSWTKREGKDPPTRYSETAVLGINEAVEFGKTGLLSIFAAEILVPVKNRIRETSRIIWFSSAN